MNLEYLEEKYINSLQQSIDDIKDDIFDIEKKVKLLEQKIVFKTKSIKEIFEDLNFLISNISENSEKLKI